MRSRTLAIGLIVAEVAFAGLAVTPYAENRETENRGAHITIEGTAAVFRHP